MGASQGSYPGTSQDGYAGYASPTSGTSDFNAHSFLIRQILGSLAIALPVKIVSVTNTGDISPVGSVDVQPLVNLLDGSGQATPHGILHALPYMRLQGGMNAVVMDPHVGDIGIAVFAHRDISSVKATKAQANPGSFRRFDLSDGMYIGGILNGTPNQYIQFNTSGITVKDLNGNTIATSSAGISLTDLNGNTFVMNSSGIVLNGVTFDRSHNISGAAAVNATGEGTFNGHTVGHHEHVVAGVQTGSGSVTSNTPTG